MADANIRAANLRSGDIQVADSISTQDVDALVEERGIGLLQTSSLGYQAMTVNLGNVDGAGEPPGQIDTPLASDPRVRLALAHAVDRDALVNSVFNNWYEPACSPISPDLALRDAGERRLPAVRPGEGPKQLLAEAGVAGAVPDHASRPATPRRRSGWRRPCRRRSSRRGFALTHRAGGVLDAAGRADAPATSTRSCSAGRAASTRTATCTRFLSTGGGNNYAGYSSEKVDTLLGQAAQSTDTGDPGPHLRPGRRAGPRGQPDHLPLPGAEPGRLHRHDRRRRGLPRRRGPAQPGGLPRGRAAA